MTLPLDIAAGLAALFVLGGLSEWILKHPSAIWDAGAYVAAALFVAVAGEDAEECDPTRER